MIQHTQFASKVATDDLRNAAVVLESRGLKKTYGSGEKSISVLTDANLSLRQGEVAVNRSPTGGGQTTLPPLSAAPTPPNRRTGYISTQAHQLLHVAAPAGCPHTPIT